MLIIDSKDCENIDKALKKYKKKFEKSKVLLQLRERQSFTKPSVKRRGEVLKAIYKQKIASGKIEGQFQTCKAGLPAGIQVEIQKYRIAAKCIALQLSFYYTASSFYDETCYS
jgi:small subunit ribosomal protein S21